jgi:sulfate transport system ATP-binding protein
MTVQISDLSRRYGRDTALTSIDLEIADGEFLALLGPSGAGKTTLLRLIAGLDRPDSGAITIDGVDMRSLAPRERRIGFVFQNYALFRHMNAARNIAFGLTVRPRRERPPRARIAARVAELLDLMQLTELGSRFPAQLSGGQRQRVALARALAIEPKVLLLDEPFGALDAQVRGELRAWLHGLQRRLGLTTVFVTHDQHEAFELADRVAILDAGRLEQVGTPADIHEHPATPFVRAFLGAADRPDGRFPSTAIDDPVFVPAERNQRACRAAGHHTAAVAAPCTAGGPARALGPAWTPRVVGVRADASLSADLPTVAAGELWLIALPGGDVEPTSLECDALARANVIVYDRALTNVVAAAMPLGGYAEPADGDGLARSLQFVRDGWRVVRLREQPSPDDRDGGAAALAQRLREAGAFPGWRLRCLSEQDGHWRCGGDTWLGNADLLPTRGPDRDRDAIVVSASGGGSIQSGIKASASANPPRPTTIHAT